MREFERWCNGPERVRRDLSLAYDVLGMLVSTERVACSYVEIAAWYDELQERRGVGKIRHLSPREIQDLVGYGCNKGAVPSGKKIWGIWGVGYVCSDSREVPKTLNETDVSIFMRASKRAPGFSVVSGISLLDEAKLSGITDPSSERVIKAFETLVVVGREGLPVCLKPLLFGEARQLAACLANTGGSQLTTRELIKEGVGRDFIPSDRHLINNRLDDVEKALSTFGLSIGIERDYPKPGKGAPGSTRYRLHNL